MGHCSSWRRTCTWILILYFCMFLISCLISNKQRCCVMRKRSYLYWYKLSWDEWFINQTNIQTVLLSYIRKDSSSQSYGIRSKHWLLLLTTSLAIRTCSLLSTKLSSKCSLQLRKDLLVRDCFARLILLNHLWLLIDDLHKNKQTSVFLSWTELHTRGNSKRHIEKRIKYLSKLGLS